MKDISSPKRKSWIERLEDSPYHARVKTASRVNRPQQKIKASNSPPLKRKDAKVTAKEYTSSKKDGFRAPASCNSSVRSDYDLRPRRNGTKTAPYMTGCPTKLFELLLSPSDVVSNPYLDSTEGYAVKGRDIVKEDDYDFDEEYSDDEEYSRNGFDGNDPSYESESDVSTIAEEDAFPFNDEIVREMYVAKIHEQKKVALQKGVGDCPEKSPPTVKFPPV